MSARDYIIARIHPHHPKVLRLAELTGECPYTVVGRAIAWFRHVDQHCHDANTGLGPQAFARILGHDAYWDAMQDPFVNWITVAQDTHTAVVVQHAANFAKSSKIRHMQARAKARQRDSKDRDERDNPDKQRTKQGQNRDRSRTESGQKPDNIGTDHGQKSDLQQQQQEEQQQQVFGDPLGGGSSPADAASPGAAVAAAAAAEISPTPDPEADTPPQARSPVVDALVAAGVSEPTRTQLAAMEGITPEIVRRCATRAKEAGKGVGVVVLDIRASAEAAVARAAMPTPGPTREQVRVREASEHAAAVDAERKQAQEVIGGLSDGELTVFHQAALRTLKPSDPIYSAWQHADPRDPGKYHGLRAAIVRLVNEARQHGSPT